MVGSKAYHISQTTILGAVASQYCYDLGGRVATIKTPQEMAVWEGYTGVNSAYLMIIVLHFLGRLGADFLLIFLTSMALLWVDY